MPESIAVPSGFPAGTLVSVAFGDISTGLAVENYSIFQHRVFRTTDSGQSWQWVPNIGQGLSALMLDAQIGFLGGLSNRGIRRTTDGGATWTACATGVRDVMDFSFIDGTCGFAVADSFARTTDGGLTWTSELPRVGLRGIWAFNAEEALAVGGGGALWRRTPLIITSVRDAPPPKRPASMHVLQNYPNPFNAETTIRFEIPQGGQTTITIYDILGRVAERLVDDILSAGVHTVSLTATSWPTGIYLCRMKSGGRDVVRKLMLVR